MLKFCYIVLHSPKINNGTPQSFKTLKCLSVFWCTKNVKSKYFNFKCRCFVRLFSKKKKERNIKICKKRIFSKISNCIAAQIEELYCKVSISTFSYERIFELIKDYHHEYYTLRKSVSREKGKFIFKAKLTLLMKWSTNLLMVLPASVQ